VRLNVVKAEFKRRWIAQQKLEAEGPPLSEAGTRVSDAKGAVSADVADASVARPGKDAAARAVEATAAEAPPVPRVIALKSWERKLLLSAEAKRAEWRSHVLELLRDGYTVVKAALPPATANELIEGAVVKLPSAAAVTAAAAPPPPRRVMRQRSGAQTWLGAKRSIKAHIRGVSNGECDAGGVGSDGVISVVAPLCTRGAGRYDFPLPPHVSGPVEEHLRAGGIRPLALVSHMLNGRGAVKTQNIMLYVRVRECPRLFLFFSRLTLSS
jgi:hypothetical protein